METKPAFSAAVVEVLTQYNYLDWSVRVKTYLMAQGLWDIVESTRGSSTSGYEYVGKDWSKTNAMALHVIQISCGPDTFADIREITSAGIAWVTLAGKYEPKGPGPSTVLGESEKRGNIDVGDEIYIELYKALQIGNWNYAKEFLNYRPDAICAKITFSGKTALHVAAEAGHVHIVEELVKRMSAENLEMTDYEGFTALARATYNGNYRMVECMVRKNENLTRIGNNYGTIPVVMAFYNEHLKLARFLYVLTPAEISTLEDEAIGASAVCGAIYIKALDVALDLVKRWPHLVVAQDRFGVFPMFALAGTPDCFPSGNQLVLWKRWIYSGIHIQSGDSIQEIRLNIRQFAGNRSRSNCKKIN